MPTKDSSILSLRIRDFIRGQAQVLADKDGVKLHAWVNNLIERQIIVEAMVKDWKISKRKKKEVLIEKEVSSH